MNLRKKISSILIITLATVTFAACGGDGDGNGNDNGACNASCPPNETDQEGLISELLGFTWAWAVACGLGSTSTLVTSSLQAVNGGGCVSGSYDITEDGFTYNNCVTSDGTILNGGATFDASGDTFSFDWNLTINDGGEIRSIDGILSCDTATGEVDFDDMSFGLDGDAVCTSGTLSVDDEFITLDGELDFSCDGGTVAECTFSGFAGTPEEVEEACGFF